MIEYELNQLPASLSPALVSELATFGKLAEFYGWQYQSEINSSRLTMYIGEYRVEYHYASKLFTAYGGLAPWWCLGSFKTIQGACDCIVYEHHKATR